MLHPQAITRPAPFSTGHSPRTCRICGAPFVGLGTLCPMHLAAQARTRAAQIQAKRARSAQIISAREIAARAAQPSRTEIPELDA